MSIITSFDEFSSSRVLPTFFEHPAVVAGVVRKEALRRLKSSFTGVIKQSDVDKYVTASNWTKTFKDGLTIDVKELNALATEASTYTGEFGPWLDPNAAVITVPVPAKATAEVDPKTGFPIYAVFKGTDAYIDACCDVLNSRRDDLELGRAFLEWRADKGSRHHDEVYAGLRTNTRTLMTLSAEIVDGTSFLGFNSARYRAEFLSRGSLEDLIMLLSAHVSIGNNTTKLSGMKVKDKTISSRVAAICSRHKICLKGKEAPAGHMTLGQLGIAFAPVLLAIRQRSRSTIPVQFNCNLAVEWQDISLGGLAIVMGLDADFRNFHKLFTATLPVIPPDPKAPVKPQVDYLQISAAGVRSDPHMMTYVNRRGGGMVWDVFLWAVESS